MRQQGATAGLEQRSGIDLYWLPLGAGGHFVKYNGRAYEWIKAHLERRPACDLYHSALQVVLPDGQYVIEQTPEPDLSGTDRGVVAEGPVGSRWAGRFRLFRYEVRVWRGGNIPDIAEAVDSPQRLSADEAAARRLLEVIGRVPRLTWGRDELGVGEMWNSNAVIAWTLVATGLDVDSVSPPSGGRAPGWTAGLAAARIDSEALPADWSR
jgi:hypothetical protein